MATGKFRDRQGQYAVPQWISLFFIRATRQENNLTKNININSPRASHPRIASRSPPPPLPALEYAHAVGFQMYEKGKTIMAKCLRREIEEMWTPLREIQAEDAAVKRASMEAIKGTEHAE